jgi:hypothetical protein
MQQWASAQIFLGRVWPSSKNFQKKYIFGKICDFPAYFLLNFA